ncbi:transposase, partial [mine drainage metagenome]
MRETLAYDLTSVLFFGVTCPLAELGYNAKDVEDQVQVNLGLLVNRSDTMPVSHALFEGSRHGVATVRNMLAGSPDGPCPRGGGLPRDADLGPGDGVDGPCDRGGGEWA